MDDSYYGEIRLFAGNYAPEGWAFCQGQLLNVAQNQVLYSVLGNMYGGIAPDTFALPDLRGQALVQQGQGDGLTNWNVGTKAGQSEVYFGQGNLPSHDHEINASAAAGNSNDPTGRIFANRGKNDNDFTDRAPDSGMNPFIIGVTGGNPDGTTMPVSLMQPYLSLAYIISLNGPIFPTRS